MFKNFTRNHYKKIAGWQLLAVFLIIVDRWLKAWALAAKPVGDRWLSFDFSLNAGLAFSLPLPKIFILIAVGLIIIGLWFYYFKLLNRGRWQALLIFSIILGATSNLIDRLAYGGVIDYWRCGSLTVFNLADALIVSGLGLLFIGEIFYGNRPATGAADNKL